MPEDRGNEETAIDRWFLYNHSEKPGGVSKTSAQVAVVDGRIRKAPGVPDLKLANPGLVHTVEAAGTPSRVSHLCQRPNG